MSNNSIFPTVLIGFDTFSYCTSLMLAETTFSHSNITTLAILWHFYNPLRMFNCVPTTTENQKTTRFSILSMLLLPSTPSPEYHPPLQARALLHISGSWSVLHTRHIHDVDSWNQRYTSDGY